MDFCNERQAPGTTKHCHLVKSLSVGRTSKAGGWGKEQDFFFFLSLFSNKRLALMQRHQNSLSPIQRFGDNATTSCQLYATSKKGQISWRTRIASNLSVILPPVLAGMSLLTKLITPVISALSSGSLKGSLFFLPFIIYIYFIFSSLFFYLFLLNFSLCCVLNLFKRP